jgi:hypothetical protein
MLDPTGPDAARTEPQQAQQVVRGHSGPARNGVNGRVNQTARNLPDSVVVSQRGAVTLVRLSRPTKRNAIDAEMIADIERVWFVRVFQFAERTSGNKEFIFPTGNLMVAASPATPSQVQPNNRRVRSSL